MTGRTSWEGLKFIAQREALVTVAYSDGATKDGLPKYSLGFGSQTDKPGAGQTITPIEAFRRLQRDLDIRDGELNKLIAVPLLQHEWDALASLHYQSGFQASRHIAWLFNHHREWAPRAFTAYHFFTEGLLSRRLKEIAIMETGSYGDLSQYKLFDGNPREVPFVLTDFPDESAVNDQPT